jgi:phosphonate transport system substrate-binding protein
VADKAVDTAAVDSLVFEQMPAETREQLKIIHRSPRFGMPPLVTPASIDEKLRKQLLGVLLTLHEHETGRKILSDLEMDKFQIIDHSMYESVEDLVDLWETKQKP